MNLFLEFQSIRIRLLKYFTAPKKFQEEYKEWQKCEEAITLLNEWLAKEKEVVKAKKELEKKQKEDPKFVINDAAFAAYFFKEIHKNTYFNAASTLGAEAREMLQKWEAGDTETVSLWKTMNSWVYAGFEETYKSLGVDFDKLYFESETYLSALLRPRKPKAQMLQLSRDYSARQWQQ
jgi:arginyl-tRNA synthetase